MEKFMIKITAKLLLMLALCVPFCFAQEVDTPLTNLKPVGQQTATWWKWTKPASYHSAIVRVRAGSSAGTGSIIQHDGTGVVAITNSHVVGNYTTASITTKHGTANCRVIGRYSNYDLAVLYAPNATATGHGLPVGSYIPSRGSDIEICGFGGPQGLTLRHFIGKMINPYYNRGVSVDAAVISGDSGSPMIHNGNIIGVNFGGPNRTPTNTGWSLVYPASSHIDGPTLATVLTQICRPIGCRPRIIYGQPQPSPQGESPLYPPSQPIELNPPANEPDVAPGPQGPPGPPGKNAEITPEQLAAIAAAIKSELSKDKNLQGPPGPQGPPGTGVNINMDQLVDEVIRRLPPIKPQWIDNDGNVIDEATVRLGQTMPMRLEVIRKAIDASSTRTK